jgi:hypothetical protein
LKLFITPLTFLSFLLSLALIDSRNHTARTHQHSPPSPSSRLPSFLQSLFYHKTQIPASSPYAYISSPDLKGEGTKRVNGERKDGREQEPWHWHTKQRQQMKAEFSDAFRIRKWVVWGLVLSGAVGVLAVGMGAVWVWRWVSAGGVRSSWRWISDGGLRDLWRGYAKHFPSSKWDRVCVGCEL